MTLTQSGPAGQSLPGEAQDGVSQVLRIAGGVDRGHVQVTKSLWYDHSFTALSMRGQWTYLALLTTRGMNAAGIVPLVPPRTSGYCRDARAEDVIAGIRELEAAGWAYPDWTACDVFISGFYEMASVHKQPRRVIGVTDLLSTYHYSEMIRCVASAELGALLAEPHVAPAPRGLRLTVLERDGWRCVRCGWQPGDPVPLTRGGRRPVFRTLEIDHIWPRSRGGADDEANYQVLCTSCNCSKGDRV